MQLTMFLKNNPNTRKIFGEKELKIIEKQLFGVSLTQSEKNRLSRDIRKKLQFIVDISRYSFDLELKKGSELKDLVNEAKETILGDVLSKRIKKIFLFGSVIKKEQALVSDIDIAVLFDDITPKEANLFRARIAGRVTEKIDIQVFNILPDKIKESILKENKTLYLK